MITSKICTICEAKGIRRCNFPLDKKYKSNYEDHMKRHEPPKLTNVIRGKQYLITLEGLNIKLVSRGHIVHKDGSIQYNWNTADRPNDVFFTDSLDGIRVF